MSCKGCGWDGLLLCPSDCRPFLSSLLYFLSSGTRLTVPGKFWKWANSILAEPEKIFVPKIETALPELGTLLERNFFPETGKPVSRKFQDFTGAALALSQISLMPVETYSNNIFWQTTNKMFSQHWISPMRVAESQMSLPRQRHAHPTFFCFEFLIILIITLYCYLLHWYIYINSN